MMSDEVRARVNAEAWSRYNGDREFSDITGAEESFDDWGYSECERRAFAAGVEWWLSQAHAPTEPAEEWEYGERSQLGLTTWVVDRDDTDLWEDVPPDRRVRRRAAGPWEPVEEGNE